MDISGYVGDILEWRRNDKDGSLIVGGCGMDMGFHTVYCLSRALFPKGFSMNLRPLLPTSTPLAYHITKHVYGKPGTVANIKATRSRIRESIAILGTIAGGCVGALLLYVIACLVFGM